MKKLIHNINQYLLERYPTVWNTKIVWMLSAALGLHLIFFFIGLLSLTNVESLHERNAIYNFFENGAFPFGIIIAILLLVVWLINLFKNNGFKNFYPTSRWDIFKQFVFYFIILFSVSTFYYSYMLGVKSYTTLKYPSENIEKNISISNKAAIFFSHSITNYTLKNKKHPAPFDTLFCENREGLIDFNKPHFSYYDLNYQYYSLYTKERKLSEDIDYYDNEYQGYVFSRTKDSIVTYFYKDTVVDVSPHIKSATPSYYNYSDVFYERSKNYYPYYYNDYTYEDSYDYNEYDGYGGGYSDPESIANNTYVYDLLKRNNPDEIKTILSDFLEIAQFYHIPNNLTTDEWFKLVYHPDDFYVNVFIHNEKNWHADLYAKEKTELEKFISDHTTNYYLDSEKLHNVFENVNTIKSYDLFSGSIHIFIWLAFGLASILLMFRVTNLRILLFSIITTGVLATFISLLILLYTFLVSSSNVEYFIPYLILMIGSTILSIPLFFIDSVKKTFSGICLNITIGGFVLYMFLIIGIISMHQSDFCRTKDYYDENCFVLIDYLGMTTSYILFIAGFVFIYFYSGIIKKWRALPEG